MTGKIYFEKLQGHFGPSSSYYKTKQRFQEILETKLNVNVQDINIQDIDMQDINIQDINVKDMNTQDMNMQNVNVPKYKLNIQPESINKTYYPETNINNLFDSNNVKKPSGINGDFIDIKLKGTAMEGFGKYFEKAEKEYGINALFLASLAAHESAMGTSRIAKNKNNLFGFQAYDRSPYASAKKFNSIEEGIMEVAKYISKNYLNENGKYFNGYSIEGIGKRYATDPNWAKSIKDRLKKIFMK